ncbi:50S ribosomal protein L34e [Candidatus Woesearchaeota archaeon]|nr:50S ribosomal protein L34e [Candidatus Woesearchaeota archaeon]
MPKPRHRSRTFRRVFVRTPKGKSVLRYRRRKNAPAQCAQCGKTLAGVARGTKTQVNRLPKSAKRPCRPYGGSLCSACTRRVLIAKARV